MPHSRTTLARAPAAALARAPQPPLCLRCGTLLSAGKPACELCEQPAGGWAMASGEPNSALARRTRTVGSLVWAAGGGVMVAYGLGSAPLFGLRAAMLLGGFLLALFGLRRAWRWSQVRHWVGPATGPFREQRVTLWGGTPVTAKGVTFECYRVQQYPSRALSSALAVQHWRSGQQQGAARVRNARALGELQLALVAAVVALARAGAIELRVALPVQWFWFKARYHRVRGSAHRIVLARAAQSAPPPQGSLERALWSALPERRARFAERTDGVGPYRDTVVATMDRPEASDFLTLTACVMGALPTHGDARAVLRNILGAADTAAERAAHDAAELHAALEGLCNWQAATGLNLTQAIAQEGSWGMKRRKHLAPLPAGFQLGA